MVVPPAELAIILHRGSLADADVTYGELGAHVMRHEIGVENLLWATDYPHPDSTWPESQQVIHTHFDDVPVDEMRLMVGGNAARIYRL